MKEDHVERSLSMNALQYAASHLLYVAGIRKQDIAFDGLTALAGGISVRFCAPRENAAGDILQGAAVPTTVSSADGQLCIPLFDGSALCHWEAGVLVLDADVLTISFLLMTAYEDTLEGPRDRYDRLSYRNSILAKYNLIEFPLIDEYAMLLRRELQEAGAALSVHRPRIVPTHDVDNLWRFRSPLSAAKSIIGGDLLHRRDPAIAADSLRSVMHSRCMPELDPLNQACIRLCTLSAEHGLTSEFYFLGYGRDETDWRYDVQ